MSFLLISFTVAVVVSETFSWRGKLHVIPESGTAIFVVISFLVYVTVVTFLEMVVVVLVQDRFLSNTMPVITPPSRLNRLHPWHCVCTIGVELSSLRKMQ